MFVGDADPAVVEAKIKKAFADWKDVGPAGAPLPRGKVELARPAAFDTFIDPAVATTVDYTIARPWKDPADTLAERHHKIVEARRHRIVQPPPPEAHQHPGLAACSAAEWAPTRRAMRR